MRVTCPGCRAVYEIPAQAADRLPARLRCGACGSEWTPEPPEQQPRRAAASEAEAPAEIGSPATEPTEITDQEADSPEAESPATRPPAGGPEPSGDDRAAEDRAPRIAATALRAAAEDGAAAGLPAHGEDTVAIPEPPAAAADPTAADPTGDGRRAAADIDDAATVVDEVTDDDETVAVDAATPGRAMRASPSDGEDAHRGTLSALEAGDTARRLSAADADGEGGNARAWIASVAVLLVLIGLFLALHGPIAHLWPASLRLYQAIGLA